MAIGGDRNEALATLAPLMAQRDAAAGRTRAFVLAAGVSRRWSAGELGQR